MKSSHERVLEGSGKKAQRKRADRPAHADLRSPQGLRSPRPRVTRPTAPRARPPKKTRSSRSPLSAAPLSGESARDSTRNWSVASDAARERATAIAIAALDKKAVGLEILDVAGKVDYADFLVIMTGRSDRHAQALAQGIEEALRSKGVKPMAVEGLPHGSWVLMDFGDVVVHVFQDDARQLYDIEGLWLDAHRLPVPASAPSD
jgi:ribosome-associated protein